MATDQQILDLIRNSLGYTLLDARDKSKVSGRLNGVLTAKPWSKLGKAAWLLAERITPVTPPLPPASYKKVAPRVAYKEGGSDARFCVINQPGVVQRIDGKYTDESGAVYTNADGLDESGIRSDGPAVTSALEIDGRPYCSLPTMGDPTKNTGSWAI